MEKHFCLNITSGDQYSSPMPMIGLYIAAGTSVCFIFMICDVLHGLRHGKPWIPCRFFSINSLSLTLLSIASKLPVDLTTPMPSAPDQLSKLSGTVLICIFISFCSISLVTQSDSERFSNMFSLSISIVTVVVNVCMQMVTGVIFSFIVEHVIVMSCMLLLLTALWASFDYGVLWNIATSSELGDLLKKSDPQNSESKTMYHRLMSFYKSSCTNHNPELELLGSPLCVSMPILSAICALVLSEAAVRTFLHKGVEFRCGVSDYKWSMWIVVVTQILTVLVGSIATVFRWFLSFKSATGDTINVTVLLHVLSAFSKLDTWPSWVLYSLSKLHILSFFKISRMGYMIIIQIITRNVTIVLFILNAVIIIFGFILFWMFKMLSICMRITKLCFGDNEVTTDYMDTKQLIQRISEEDIKMQMVKYKRDSPTHLIRLLSQKTPSQVSIATQISTIHQNKVSCLLVVVFVRVATILLPNNLSASLIHTLDEAFEVIFFIDKQTDDTDYDDKMRRVMAKELWMNRDNTFHWFHRKIIKPSVKKIHSQSFKKSMDGESQFQPQLDHLQFVVGIIEELKVKCSTHTSDIFGEETLLKREMDTIYYFIMELGHLRSYTLISQLHCHMEQLFVDILHFFLSQLPLSTFKHLIDSPIEQCEERARLALKFFCKLEPVEFKVHWSFPDGTGINSLITPQIPSTEAQYSELVEDNVDADVGRRVIEDDEIQEIV